MACLFCLSVISVFAFVLYFLFGWSRGRWQDFGIPILPGRLPIFGHVLPAIVGRRSMVAICENAYEQAVVSAASMCGFYYMNKPALLVRDPELIKTVLLKKFANFHDNAFFLNPKLDPVMCKTPFFNAGETWKTSRNRIVNHFSGRKLGILFSIVDHVGERLINFVNRKIAENGGDDIEFELKEFFSRFTCEIVANAAFGVEGQNFEDNPDKSSFAEVAKEMFVPDFVQFANQHMTFFAPRIAHALGVKFMPESMDNYFRQTLSTIIDERRRTGKRSEDFLQFIIDYEENDVDLEWAMAEAISFFLDVYETSGLTMAYFLFRLANDQKVQEKLRAEIRMTLKENDGKLTYEALKNMSYLDQALSESMRITPTLGLLMKVCTQKTTLEGSDGLACDIEPGSLVFISVASLHRDEKIWKEPHVYDPERFGSGKSRDNFTFLPFGAGPRMCVGQRMGLLTVKLGIVKLVNSYFIKKSLTRNKLEMNPAAPALISQYAKDGVYTRFKKLDI